MIRWNYFHFHMRRKRIKYAQSCSIFISIIEFEKTRGLCIVTTQIEIITHFEKRIHWKCVIFSKCSATVHVIPSIHLFKCWQKETIGLVDGYNRINQVISLQSININNIGPPYNKHLRKMDCVSFEIWFYFWKTDACFILLY